MNGNDEAPRTGAPQTPFRVPLFAGFDAPALPLVIEVLQKEKLPAGHVAIEDNTPGETLDTVTSGRVQVSKTIDNGLKYVFPEMGRASFLARWRYWRRNRVWPGS